MNKKDIALLQKLEVAWNTCKQPDWLLWVLDRIGYRDNRALRLYACACVRATPLGKGYTVWDLLVDYRFYDAIEISERYAMDMVTKEDLHIAWKNAWDAANSFTVKVTGIPQTAIWNAGVAASCAARDSTKDAVQAVIQYSTEAAAQTIIGAAQNATWDFVIAAAGVAARDAALEWQANKLREFVSWEQISAMIPEEVE